MAAVARPAASDRRRRTMAKHSAQISAPANTTGSGRIPVQSRIPSSKQRTATSAAGVFRRPNGRGTWASSSRHRALCGSLLAYKWPRPARPNASRDRYSRSQSPRSRDSRRGSQREDEDDHSSRKSFMWSRRYHKGFRCPASTSVILFARRNARTAISRPGVCPLNSKRGIAPRCSARSPPCAWKWTPNTVYLGGGTPVPWTPPR